MTPPSGEAVIETASLTKVYPGDVTALGGLTVAFAPGITGLIGANGAGKSTLIKILLGLLAPTQGMAKVLGHDCVKDGERIRQLVGYMPEHDCLPPDVSATEFVSHMGRMAGLPATVARERAAESLRHVGLHEERYRQIGTYSTGMKQRVKLSIVSARSSRPASIATRLSQIRSISPSRCEATTIEMPNSAPIRSISSSIAFRPAGSSPFVGSSSRSSLGSPTSAWASFTRCFMPVE